VINIVIAVFVLEGCYGLPVILDIAVIVAGFFSIGPINNGFTFFNQLPAGVAG
jgi:hypothetical protein